MEQSGLRSLSESLKRTTRVQVQNGRIAQNQAEKQQKLKWSQISIESLKCP